MYNFFSLPLSRITGLWKHHCNYDTGEKTKEKLTCFVHQVKTGSCMFMLADVRMMV